VEVVVHKIPLLVLVVLQAVAVRHLVLDLAVLVAQAHQDKVLLVAMLTLHKMVEVEAALAR
jgi:hypothetical protein